MKAETKKKVLVIKCDPNGQMETMPWKTLKSMQGDFKTLDDEGRQTLRASMEKVGFKAPFFVWYGHNELLDGVQRTDVLEDMKARGKNRKIEKEGVKSVLIGSSDFCRKTCLD